MKTAKTPALRSWLDLVPLSARAHRRQNRMTLFCIVLAVSLVATIFAMADMELRTQRRTAIRTDGNWHVATTDLTADQAAVVAARPDVAAVGLYDVANYHLDGGYTLAGQEVAVCGSDTAFYTEIFPLAILEGRAPAAPDEAVLTESARRQGLGLGDSFVLQSPTGAHTLTVVGFIETTTMLSRNDAAGVVLTLDGFGAVSDRHELNVYIRFTPLSDKQRAIRDIEAAFALPDGALKENARLMTLDLSTSNRWLASLYGTALVLFVLVLAAGVLMIAGTLNSSVAARTAFFGLLRCLGATPRQVRRYVRRESLQWCAAAVPAGLAVGTLVSWGLCALLRALAPGYFYDMPMFALSPIALVFGRQFAYSLPARTADGQDLTVNLVTYEENQFRWAGRELLEGAVDPAADFTVLTVYDPAGPAALAVGDRLELLGRSLTVGGLLSSSPLDREEGVVLLICNEATFAALTGETGYTILDIQVEGGFTDAALEQVRTLAGQATGGDYVFSDRRASNLEGRGAYLAIGVFFYGFEVVIALITVLSILNCIQMSVSARLPQYGAMRAVGLTVRQLLQMVLAESACYAAVGCAAGLALGLPLHRALYRSMITLRWGTDWTVPWGAIGVIVALVAGSALLAARAPARRLRGLSVTATIASE